MGKLLVFVGLAITAVGLLVMLGLPLGRLPGDIVIRRGSFSFRELRTTNCELPTANYETTDLRSVP
jgi:hypothetical protein